MDSKIKTKKQSYQIDELQRKRESCLRDGIAFYKAKKYREAVEACNLAIQVDPTYTKAYYVKGLALIEIEHYEETVIVCERAIQINPNETDICINKAIALYKLGHYDQALIVCSQVLQIDANHPRAYHGRALANLALERYEEVITDCSRALQLDSQSARANMTLGDAFFALHRYTEAFTVYNKAVYLNGYYKDICMSKVKILLEEGKMLFEIKKYDDSYHMYEQILIFNMDDEIRKSIHIMIGDILLEKAIELFEMKYYKASSEAFWEAIRDNSIAYRIYDSKGKMLIDEAKRIFKDKKYNEALKIFSDAILFGYSLKDAYIGKAFALFWLENIEKNYSSYNDIVAYFNLRKSRSQNGLFYGDDQQLLDIRQKNEIVDAIAMTCMLGYDLIDIYKKLSIIFLEKGKDLFEQNFCKEALVTYRYAFSICKNILNKMQYEHDVVEGEILLAIGEVLFALRDYKDIIQTYKQARNSYQRDSYAYHKRTIYMIDIAESLFFEGKYKDACIAYKKVILFNPDFPNLEDDYKDKGRDLLTKSLDFYELGHLEEAYLAYKQAILFDPNNENVSWVRGRSLDGVKHFVQSHAREQVHLINTIQSEISQISDVEVINYAELMVEGYDGIRKVDLVDDVDDPDNYDDHYNQYYERDLGDEADEYFERIGLL